MIERAEDIKKIFYYHDNTYKQNWLAKRFSTLPQRTVIGCFIKEGYPFGFQSAFVFVDHCDFDTPKKVEAIFYGTSNKDSSSYGKKGIVGTGLTATKTIFVDASGTENIGLEDKTYKELTNRLYQDGVEIAAHSLRPKISLARTDPRLERDLDEMEKFKTKTWVDHGYLIHNITRYGWNEKSQYYILDKLLKRGYLFFWSKIDYSLNAPDGNLNLLNLKGRAGKDYFLKVLKLIKRRRSPTKIIFVFFWDFIGNLLGWQAKDDLLFAINIMKLPFKRLRKSSFQELFEPNLGPIVRSLKNLINPFFYLQIVQNFFFTNALNSLTIGLYSLTLDRSKRIYLFPSLWVNDCVNCYAPENIERLTQEEGLHIGHNYFCVEEDHYLNLSVRKVGDHYIISEEFQKNLEYLASCQKEKKVWVTTISKLGEYLRNLTNVDVQLVTDSKMVVKNLSNAKIEGVTFSVGSKRENTPQIMFSSAKKWDFLQRDNKIVFWFDLEPKEELFLEVAKF